MAHLFLEDGSIAMTEAQRAVLPHDLVVLNEMVEADRRGDAETYRELRSQLEVPVWMLKALKRAGYADYIREAGLNTTLADKELGPGWLDRKD